MDNFVADAIYIDADPRKVFDTLTEPEEILSWLDAQSVTVDARIGGGFKIERASGVTTSGTIAVLEPGARLELSDYWLQGSGESRGPMRLLFEIEPRDDGSWLVVRQSEMDKGPQWREFVGRTRKEWVGAMVALKRHIEQI